MPSFSPSPARLRRHSAAVGLLSAAALAGCDVGDPYTSTNELPENPGVIVAAAGTVSAMSDLVWSADGATLTFETDGGSLAVLSLQTGSVATIDGPRDEHSELSAASAGRAVYFLADRNGGHRGAYRLDAAGSAVQLTDRAPGSAPIAPGDGTLVAGGPLDREAAFVVDPDSLFLFDNATAERRFVAAGCARIVAFAPAGGRILCKRPAQGTFGVFDVATDAVQTIVLAPGERESILLRTRWIEADSIQSLYRTLTRFRLRDAASGNAYSLWMPVFFAGVRETDFRNWSWSADGSRFVFWIHECLKLDRLGGCDFGQSVLYAVDIGANEGGAVVVVKGTKGADRVAISPDGARVAFIFQDQLHLQVLR